MDFPEAGLTEQEEIKQILEDIDDGCCVGEFSETGEIRREEQALFQRDGLCCSDSNGNSRPALTRWAGHVRRRDAPDAERRSSPNL